MKLVILALPEFPSAILSEVFKELMLSELSSLVSWTSLWNDMFSFPSMKSKI